MFRDNHLKLASVPKAKRNEVEAELNRCIVLYIKTTNSHNWSAENGDRLTQIACVEKINGKLTGKTLHLYINPNNAQLLQDSEKNYRDNLNNDAAAALIEKMRRAPIFRDAQATFLDFLGDPSTTTILVHCIKRVLDFLRNELDANGKIRFEQFRDGMIDMRSKCSHFSGYHAGQVADEIDTNREVFLETKRLYQFDYILDELKVPNSRNRDAYNALTEAKFLSKADDRLATLMAPNHQHKEGSVKRACK